MARHKEFDPDKALDKAMQLFWLQGYKATSVQDLCSHMGIQKGSFYDTFDDKQTLFLATLERYSSLNEPLSSRLEKSGSAKAVIVAIFNEQVDLSVDDEACRGCFMVNSIVELTANDPTFAPISSAARQGYEEMFYHLLLMAKEAGEVASNRDLTALARFLTSAMFGLRVTAKTTRKRAVLEDIVSSVLAILD
jgi:TetR/AcrR family transcriptional repressor of nem operon